MLVGPLLALLLVLPAPASAYILQTGGFTTGVDSAFLSFGPFDSALVGPSIRLLTNSTVESASVVVAGAAGYVNSSFQETSTTDFASYKVADGIAISGGTLALERAAAVLTINASNSFANATLTNVNSTGGTIQLQGSTTGSFTTGTLAAPAAGWGNLLVYANTSLGGTVAVDVLRPNGTALITSQPVGGVVDLDPIVWPSIRLKVTLSAPSVAASPVLWQVTLGQLAGDTLVDGAVARTFSGAHLSGGVVSIESSKTSYDKYSGNPVIRIQSGTYYAARIVGANIFLDENGTYHGYFAVTSSGTTGTSIGHATSLDLWNWSFDASPIIAPGSSGWDSHHIDFPWVVENPAGSPRYFLYYSGWPSATRFYSGLATSDDLYNWTKYSGNPVLSASSSGWDTWNSGNPVVKVENGTWKMWYAGTTVTTGGGNSMGYATSTDGYNWTKYSSNPVLPRSTTSGAIDRDDLQLTTLRYWDGTYYAFFACIPTGGLYHGCMATSNDGISWTKYSNYVIGPQGTGWEREQGVPNDIIANNGNFIMFYHGCSTSCGTIQIGRADGTLQSGSTTGTLDFGGKYPASLTSAVADVAGPPGTTASVFIRSSSDGSSWSAFEALPPSGSISTTPAREFVQWRIDLSTGSTGVSPEVRGLELRYESYRSWSRYESSLFTAAEPVSAAAVSVRPAAPPGMTVTIEVSNDNGSTWTRAYNSTTTQLGTLGTEFRYALELEGTTYGSPIVDSVDLAIQRRGFPENVTVRLGVGGTPFLNVSGVFDYAYNVSLSADELNGIINYTKASFPSATFVDVPFVVTSTHYGQVELSAPRLAQALKNPLSVAFSPASFSISVLENTTTTFAAPHSVYPPSTKVNTTWMLDGNPLPGQVDRVSYNFSTNFTSAGNYTIRVDVENGDFAFNHTWQVTVLNVNRRPQFGGLAPSDPFSMSHAASQNFSALATDADSEPLTWVWRLDGQPVGSSSPRVAVSNLPVGQHVLEATVFDPYDSIFASWNITSTNGLPQIVSRTPTAPAFNVSHASSQVVSITATDVDGEPLTYRWVLDGIVIPSNASSYTVSGLSPGIHSLTVFVDDAYGSASTSWSITSTNSAPSILSRSPSSDFQMSHTGTQVVSVSALDQDGEALMYVWSLDGSPIANATSAQVALSNLSVGAHTLTLNIRDAFTSSATAWIVLSTNAVPVLGSAIPAEDVSASHTSHVDFVAAFLDGDGDPLMLTWFVDGVESANGTSSFTLTPVGMGGRVVEVLASDGMAVARRVWNVTGTNDPPEITSFSPVQDLTISIVDTVDLAVVATDPDGDPVNYSWRIGTLSLPLTTPSVTVGPFSDGPHDIVATVSDGRVAAIHVFHVTATNFAPAIVDADPAADFEMGHTESRTVSVSVLDHEGDIVTYVWSMGSQVLTSTTETASVGPLPAGIYHLHVVVRDGTSHSDRSWNLTVHNDPPAFVEVSPPEGEVDAVARTDVTFSARAADPDGDQVVLQWSVDNIPRNVTGMLTLQWPLSGKHTVTVDAVSTGHVVSLRWNVTVTQVNGAPTIAGAAPAAAEIAVATGTEAVFAVEVDDDGVLPLTVTWFLDDLESGQGAGYVFRPTGSDVGTHEVRVVVADGEFSEEKVWDVNVYEPVEVTSTGGLEDILPLVLGLAIGAGGAAAAFIVLRRAGGKRDTADEWERPKGPPGDPE